MLMKLTRLILIEDQGSGVDILNRRESYRQAMRASHVTCNRDFLFHFPHPIPIFTMYIPQTWVADTIPFPTKWQSLFEDLGPPKIFWPIPTSPAYHMAQIVATSTSFKPRAASSRVATLGTR